MTFSRTHAGMIGLISLFTGMIAPVFSTEGRSYAFPLTDSQIYSYILLILLSVAFYVISIKKWNCFKWVGSAILILVLYITSIGILGRIHSLDGYTTLTHPTWGWIFLVFGGVGITYALFSKSLASDDKESYFSDMIIGFIGTLIMLGLSALIISVSVRDQTKQIQDSILSSIFGTGGLTHGSGYIQSPHYNTVSSLLFERRDDSIYWISESSDNTSVVYPSGVILGGTGATLHRLGKNLAIIEKSRVHINSNIYSHSGVVLHPGFIGIKQNSNTMLFTEEGTRTLTGDVILDSITYTEGGDVFAWIERIGTGYVVLKDGKQLSSHYPQIELLGISKNGYDTIAKAIDTDGMSITLKNGVPTETIRPNIKARTWKTNGSHTIYATTDTGSEQIIYDGVSIGKDFQNIREIFLESNGNSYAFFAQSKGEETYCLYTRFRGNLCGLVGYMNPRISADGSSIIYAGLRDGKWSIYRNTTPIIQDTGYTTSDNSGDYVFFDITNPKQYVFLQKRSDGSYQIRKNGKIISKVWDDVGLDVTFGYNNTVIMSAKDATGWRIIEL